MNPPLTPERAKEMILATIEAVKALTQLIVDKGGMPNGHLYATCMGHLSFETYLLLIDQMKKAGLITERNHWLAPTERAIKWAASQPGPDLTRKN